jgi:hypothetical protein
VPETQSVGKTLPLPSLQYTVMLILAGHVVTVAENDNISELVSVGFPW